MATNVQLFGKMATVASAAAGTAGYVWEDPGDSIMIQVSLDLVERLSAAVQQGLGAGPRGNEIAVQAGVVRLGRYTGARRADVSSGGITFDCPPVVQCQQACNSLARWQRGRVREQVRQATSGRSPATRL